MTATGTKAKTKSKKPTECKCMKEVDEQLKAMGVRLKSVFSIDFIKGTTRHIMPLLAVEWADKPLRGKKLPDVLCSYCPVCGKKKEN